MRIFPLVLTLLFLAAPQLSAADRPNFLVILCDDLGYGDLECYGHPHIKTPHLNQLAAEGIRLTDCYSSAPVCSSSRAGLLTGQTPNRVGVYDWIPSGHVMHLPAKEKTVANLLKEAGYDTAHVGKWHCNGKFNSDAQPQPDDHGFDHWFSTQNNAIPRHENPRNFVRNGKEVGPLEGFSCQLVAEEGIDWLKSREKSENPFFMFVCFHEPHEPVESPDALVKKYLPVAKDPDEAQYFANVENMDAAVGKLMSALDELNLAEETLVFFTSDNGPETLDRYRNANRSYGSPGPLRGMKLHIYEGGIRVAGIVRWKGKIASGQTSSQPVAGFDILPTFCDLGGADVPDNIPLDGCSFEPLLHGEKIVRPQPMFWHYYRALSEPCAALRDGDWKIVARWDAPHIYYANLPGGGNVTPTTMKIIKTAQLTEFELYNLKDDLAETKDLSTEHPDRLEKMKQAILARYAEVQKNGPTWTFPAAKK
ncbi:MAG: sulfatase-like hydrolase/transferase [Planctomycetaceae bacterium]|nr:sulfatase-like hydrolase/transferase [Planctomycetaceae bacterium]